MTARPVPERVRLDILLCRRGLFPSRERAQAAVLAGRVWVAGRPESKAGRLVPADAAVEVRGDDLPYVGRGGLKLERALDAFGLNPAGRVALDVGASTGGFTDCLLQRGARRVYAVDVGYGQLAWKLRQDTRVVLLERTNARHLTREQVPDPVDLAAIDVSFISLEKVLPAVRGLLAGDGRIVALVKPQFGAGPARVGKGGVVRDPAVHREVLRRVGAAAAALGLEPADLIPSPIRGDEGNVEFLLLLQPSPSPRPLPEETIERAVARAHAGRLTEP